MRSCSDECRRSEENRYIIEHGLTEEEVAERLALIEAEKETANI
jgi:UPF0176 protein